jgi:hypothetical protein
MSRILTCFLLLSPFILFGCAVEGRFEAPPRTFLEDVSIAKTMKTMPFRHAWVDPKSVQKNYTSVFVRPIRIDLLSDDAWKRSSSIGIHSKEDYEKEAQQIADYFHEQLVAALNEASSKRFQVADTPSKSALIVSIALTEVEFSHPIPRAAALAAPLPGVDMALNTITDPHVAFAARFTDPVSNELQASAADRRYPPLRLIDLNKLTITSSTREIVKDWSRELAEAIQSNRFATVERTSRFSLLPW